MTQDDQGATTGPTNHDHSGFDLPAETGDRFGAPGEMINTGAIGVLVGASLDGCTACQTAQLDVIQSYPLTVTRLVELSAMAVNGQLGGIPPNMTTTGQSNLGSAYRNMLRVGVDTEDHSPMLAIALALDDDGRRQAANDALTLLVGVLAIGR